MQRIAIVGAGLAGLTAARELDRAGLAVSVFDKARGPGGRTSTRRAAPFAFDHGAQYFTCRSERFRKTVEHWCERDAAAEWRGEIVSLAAGVVTPLGRQTQRFVGTPRMSAIARHLSHGIDVSFERRLAALDRRDGRWTLRFEHGPELSSFDAVLLAVPAPQAVPLLETAGLVEFAEAARGIPMSPCHAVMLGFDTPLDLPFDGAFVDHSEVGWLARNTSKPGRPPEEAWVVHTTPEWSADHLDTKPERVVELVARALEQALGTKLPRPSHAAAHAWRLARAAVPGAAPAAWSPDRRVGVCGDWMHGDRVESAVTSGFAIAEEMLQDLPGDGHDCSVRTQKEMT